MQSNETYIVTSSGAVTVVGDRYSHVGVIPKAVRDKVAEGALVVFWDGEKATALDAASPHTLDIVAKAEKAMTPKGPNGITVNVNEEKPPEGYVSKEEFDLIVIAVGAIAAIGGFILGAASVTPTENTHVYYVLPNGDVAAAA